MSGKNFAGNAYPEDFLVPSFSPNRTFFLPSITLPPGAANGHRPRLRLFREQPSPLFTFAVHLRDLHGDPRAVRPSGFPSRFPSTSPITSLTITDPGPPGSSEVPVLGDFSFGTAAAVPGALFFCPALDRRPRPGWLATVEEASRCLAAKAARDEAADARPRSGRSSPRGIFVEDQAGCSSAASTPADTRAPTDGRRHPLLPPGHVPAGVFVPVRMFGAADRASTIPLIAVARREWRRARRGMRDPHGGLIELQPTG